MAVEIDAQNLKTGLLGLVVALVEILRDVLTLEALKRLRAASLTDDEAERLGQALRDLDAALESIKAEHGLQEVVDRMRRSLDELVEDLVGTVTGAWEPCDPR